MKFMMSALILTHTLAAFSKDMSRTEGSEAWRRLSDGSRQYRGGCSTHEDYEKNKFVVTKTLVPSFEPEYSASRAQVMPKLSGKIELKLVEAAEKILLTDGIQGVDDFAAEKIEHKSIRGLDLYRLNIGVGGGNGMYLVFHRAVRDRKAVYELMSNVFDGDIEFCDSKVWMK